MRLIKFEYDKGITYCFKCGVDTDCPECYAKMDYCYNCGEIIEKHDCFIVFTDEKYYGADRMSNKIATLIIDGNDYATAHINPDESDAEVDVAHMQLCYIPDAMQIDTVAEIIAAFAKWIRFDWRNPDIQNQTGLPVLVRLIGYTIDKRYGMPWKTDKWIALQNALEIKKEHLAFEFTSKEIM